MYWGFFCASTICSSTVARLSYVIGYRVGMRFLTRRKLRASVSVLTYCLGLSVVWVRSLCAGNAVRVLPGLTSILKTMMRRLLPAYPIFVDSGSTSALELRDDELRRL